MHPIQANRVQRLAELGVSRAYARAFAAGERDAWADRGRMAMRLPPGWAAGSPDAMRGWRDGYHPRNPAWALRTAPVRAFHERAEAR